MEHTAVASAKELGLEFQVGPIPLPRPPLSEDEEERALADSIRQKSLVRVDVLSEILTAKAIDATASVKTIVDALDSSFKLSGLAAKNLPKEGQATSVSITINMPATTQHPQPPRVVTGEVVAEEPAADG